MRHRVEALVGPGGEEDVGVDVPLGVRAHLAARRRRARLPVLVHDLRRGRRGAADGLRASRPERRPEALPAPQRARHDQRREERARPAGGVRGEGIDASSSAASPTSTASTRHGCSAPARWTSTTC